MVEKTPLGEFDKIFFQYIALLAILFTGRIV